MHSARLAAAVVGMVLATCLLINPPASAAEEYDITVCGASTITTLSSSAEMTMLAIDTKGSLSATTRRRLLTAPPTAASASSVSLPASVWARPSPGSSTPMATPWLEKQRSRQLR